MRVALLSYNAPAPSAVGKQLVEKVLAFTELGAEVRLFVQSAELLPTELRAYTQVVSQVEAAGPTWDFLSQADLVLAVYAQAYDLLHYLPLLVGGKPRLLLHYHGVTPPVFGSELQREALERSVRQRGLAWCVDHVLADSQASALELRQAFNFPAQHMTALPLSIDSSRYLQEPRSNFLQQRLGLPSQTSIMLFVGRLAVNKRVPVLVETMAELRVEMPDLHAVVIGDDSDLYGIEAVRCQKLAQDLGVADRFHLLGQAEEVDLVRAYRSADVLVIPSVHEGFCVPIVEAMAAELPVIATRTTAIPETIADAGLTFSDQAELLQQLRRVLRPKNTSNSGGKKRVAVVSFRFGSEIVGGAETSLRTLALALQDSGTAVEVFTTCTASESRWHNELPAGTFSLGGLTVHRHLLDPHDRAAHEQTVAQILEAGGLVSAELEARYLQHSIHSSALVARLHSRLDEFDAIIVGPYLFGLSADIAQAFPDKTVLVPCFHHEPLAKLQLWPRLYSQVAGLLYHSPEEQDLAQTWLGVNHPNSGQLGTCLKMDPAEPASIRTGRPYIIYCGRFSAQKNMPRLLEWATRYQREQPHRIDVVFLGQGELPLPTETWLLPMGRVEESVKHKILAGALALVQLSEQESLSLVVLEAWAQGRPVIVSSRCPVLAGQSERAQGGWAVDGYAAFAASLDQLLEQPEVGQQLGMNGQAYVRKHYADPEAYVGRIQSVLQNIQRPLTELMRARGVERAQRCDRGVWRQALGKLVERLLDEPARPFREEIRMQACQPEFRVGLGMHSALLPIRISNEGSHALAAEGPGRYQLNFEMRDQESDDLIVFPSSAALPMPILPGQTQTAVIPLTLPAQPGNYRLVVSLSRVHSSETSCPLLYLPVQIDESVNLEDSLTTGLLDTVQQSLSEANRLGRLPKDYVDVSNGPLGSLKLQIKQKLLNNFKLKYVDVLSRQQTQVNEQLVLAVQQLSDCCSALGQAVRGLQTRLDQLETKLARLENDEPPESADPIFSKRSAV